MATRLYLRQTSTNFFGGGAEKSVALPVGTANGSFGDLRDLSTVKGAAQTGTIKNTLAQTPDQDGPMAFFYSPALAVAQIDANTWTFAIASSETSTNANAFTCISLYVLQSDDTVRGFITDSHTSRGVEYATTEDGQVFTIAGSAVAGVVSTDKLVLEVWYHGVQAMATSYSVNIYYSGATDVIDSTTTNAASYIETPQNLFTAPAAPGAPKPVVAPSLAAQQASRW